MQVFPLSEGSFTVDSSKKFVPFNKEKDDLQLRPTGSLLVEIQPFVIVTSRDVIVIDTGLGFRGSGEELQIHENLAAHNIKSTEVTKVLLSHLHKDHSGGIMDKEGKFSFPNAHIYVGRQEFDYAMDKSHTSYIQDDFSQLSDYPLTVFLPVSGSIDGYIQYETTGGHSPYHMSFTIIENNEIVFYGGDVAPQLQQMKRKLMAKYDHDGRRAMELREQWLEQGKKENWKLLFYHDIKTPTAIL